jgi:hypothetical protein
MHEPINFDSRPDAPEIPQIHLFTLDGREYFIPERIRPAVGLKYLYTLKTQGEQHAVAELLFAVLGNDAMAALSDSDAVTETDLKVIMEIVKERAVGALDEGN